MQYYKDFFYNFFNLFGLYEIAIMGFFFIIFFIFFLLGLLLAGRKILPHLMFFLATAVFIFAPIGLQMSMQKFLYTTEAHITESKRLLYIDAFFLQGQITNVGFSPFSVCEASVSVLRDGILRFLNPVFPLEKYSKTIKMPLKPGESAEFSVVLDNFSTQLPFEYRVDIDCHNVSGLIKSAFEEDSHTNEDVEQELKHTPSDTQESTNTKEQDEENIKDEQSNQENAPQFSVDSNEASSNTSDTQELPAQNQIMPLLQDNASPNTQSEIKENVPQPNANEMQNQNNNEVPAQSNTQTNSQNSTQPN